MCDLDNSVFFFLCFKNSMLLFWESLFDRWWRLGENSKVPFWHACFVYNKTNRNCNIQNDLTELEDPGRRQMHFGNTAGNVGQQGTNSGNVAVGHQWNYNGKRQMHFGNYNGKRQMHFGNTAGNVGQQGTNSGNVAVGSQRNGRKWMKNLFLPIGCILRKENGFEL